MELYKNTRQQEFCELMEVMRGREFKPADVARLIKKTPGVVSQYLSGKTNPSETVLSLFRRVVKEKTGREEKIQNEITIQDQLSDLEKFSPPDYEVAKTTIKLLHNKLSGISNSKVAAGAKRISKKVAASVNSTSPK